MVKKKQILFLIIAALFLLNSYSSVKAITQESSTGENAGGPTIYTKWFDDLSGVLIVSSTFANGSGAVYIDVNVVVSCVNPDRVFRLRVWDSDADQYINPEAELGLGTHERLFGLMVHEDTRFLSWKLIVSDEIGLLVFTQLELYFIYDPYASYRPVINEEEQGNITPEELKKEQFYTGLSWFIVTLITAACTGLVVVQREGQGIKHLFRNKFKGEN